jgi:hypothetical protein
MSGDVRAGQESLTVGSWRPPISEVHGLASHSRAVRSVVAFTRCDAVKMCSAIASRFQEVLYLDACFIHRRYRRLAGAAHRS